MAPVDYYAVLGVARNADQETIRKAFHAQQIKYHPDKHAYLPPEFQQLAADMSKKINKAYGTLKDPKKRAAYDNMLKIEDMPSDSGTTSDAHHHEEREREERARAREEKERRARAEQEERERRRQKQEREERQERARTRENNERRTRAEQEEREKRRQEQERKEQARREKEAAEKRVRIEHKRGIIALVIVLLGIPLMLIGGFSMIMIMKPPPPPIQTATKIVKNMTATDGWGITCLRWSDVHEGGYCLTFKDNLFVSLASKELARTLDISIHTEMGYVQDTVSLRIDDNPAFFSEKQDNVWRDTAAKQQATPILHRLMKGKVARAYYTNRDGKRVDIMIQLGNFSEVYSQLERTYNEWFPK